MIIDRTHIRWGVVTAAILAVATVAYVAYVRNSLHGPSGGSLPGLIFGIIAALLMVYAFLLAVRRRMPAARLGSGQFWLRGHLWMGALTVPMVLFHSGFGFGGLLEQVLMSLFGVVVFSGIYGLLVQHVIPRLMQQVIPHETFMEQIPFLSRCNLILCDQVVAKQCGSLDVSGDSFAPTMTSLVNHAAKLGREEKDKWLEGVDPEWHGMLRSLARRAKEASWNVIKEDGKTATMRQESDFPMALRFMYVLNGVVPAKTPSAEGTASDAGAKPAAVPKPSALQLARKLPADADKPEKPAESPVAGAVEPPALSSTVESQANRQLAAATPAKPAAKVSPLEMARRQAAAKAGGAPVAAPVIGDAAAAGKPSTVPSAAQPETATEGEKPAATAKLSPLQLARMQAAAKKEGAPATTPPPSADVPAAPIETRLESMPVPAAVESPVGAASTESGTPEAAPKLSPLQLARQQAAAKQGHAPAGTEPVVAPVPDASAPAPEKPAAVAKLSPLQLARMQAAAKREDAPVQAAGDTAPPPAASNEIASVPVSATPVVDSPAGAAPEQPAAAKLSPLEMARRQAAAKAAATGAVAPKRAVPAPAVAAPPAATPVPAIVAPVRVPGSAAAEKPGPPVKKPAPSTAEPPAIVPQQSLDRLKQFYLRDGARGYLKGEPRSSGRLSVTENAQREFARLRGELPVVLHEVLDSIEHYCDEQRQLLHLQRLHRELHWWLAVHIPASVAVMVLMFVHIVMSMRVIPFSF